MCLIMTTMMEVAQHIRELLGAKAIATASTKNSEGKLVHAALCSEHGWEHSRQGDWKLGKNPTIPAVECDIVLSQYGVFAVLALISNTNKVIGVLQADDTPWKLNAAMPK
jgi:hypothetical protein